ncbi:MAG: hypothetical protein JRH20_20315, partial [Deltaproteobacteria bacterium]|nr:hypothetical protein [Deltaproteobacteria bacterium]
AAGNSFNCALLEEALGERSQLCWGEGWFGQFGAPPTYGGPTSVPFPFDVERLALGGDHSCALDSRGSVTCWGTNLFGQTGRDDTEGRDVHLLADALPIGKLTAKKVACGQNHCCAITADDEISCWGRNVAGQLAQTPHRSGAKDTGRAQKKCSRTTSPM